MTIQIQCDSCAFKLSESQAELEDDIAIENKYAALRSLINSTKKPRAISVSIGGEKTDETDKTETCFINSPLWHEDAKTVYCPDRIDSALSLESALSLRNSSEANRIAFKALETAKDEASAARLAASAAREQARFAKWAAIIAVVTAIIMINEQINSTIAILLNNV